MTTSAAVRARVRLELGDESEPFQTSALTDGVVNRFEIPFKPLGTGPSVYLLDNSTGHITGYVEGVDFTIDYENGYALFNTAPPEGNTLVITGVHYRYFRDDDIDSFVGTAFLQQVNGRTDATGGAITLATLPPVEEYPLAILATIEALWALYTDTAMDIDIIAPDGVTIPRHQRNQQLLEAISNRRAQYQELAELLGIGLYRVEVFQTRRVSLATGRLVPIFQAREVEDNRYARRIFLPPNTYGGQAEQVMQTTHLDLHAVAFDSFSQQVTGLGNLTGKTVHAAVRPYEDALSKLAQFTVTVDDVVNGVVTVSLTSEQTFSLRRTAFWDLQTQDTSGNIATLVQGDFTVERQGGF